jgi:cell division protein FtsI (penicillin-binding protein 3)
MSKDVNDRIILENYENRFVYKKDKSNLNITFNRIAFIFFVFFFICIIYSVKVFYLGFSNNKIKTQNTNYIELNNRADILDKNGNFLVKTVNTINIGIKPNFVIDKKKFLLNLRLIFPNKDLSNLEKKLKKKKFFYLEKTISPEKYEKLIQLGDKSIITEEKISRIYPQQNLFSHILGQIDDNNNGISGIEKFFDYELKKEKKPLKLTVDIDIQFLIRQELLKFQKIFQNIGSAAILMNVNNGEILSLVSLPDFDLNKRANINDEKYINRVTKGLYELGSVFKTFTIASGLNEGVIETDTKFLDSKKKIYCDNRPIREYDNKIPPDLTVEQILIRSGNIGSVRIARKIGIQKHKSFLRSIGILDQIEFDIEEVSQPSLIRWEEKCKLETVAYGHGINTTILQLAKAYSIISNGGYDIRPTLIKKNQNNLELKKRILKEGVSEKMNLILRKIVSTKEGTAGLANIKGYEVGGKTGTAEKAIVGGYTRKAKVNTFASIFPTSQPKYVLIVLLDEPKISEDYIYEYKNKKGSFKGTPFNTAGWTSVEVVGKILEKIGPILATKYLEIN